jgi:hypothetical protein
MLSEKLAEGIYRYPNSILKPNSIIDFIENVATDTTSPISDWQTWKTEEENPYIFGKQKRENVEIVNSFNSLNYDDCKTILASVRLSIEYASKDYAKINLIDNIGTLAPLSFSKYNINAAMGPHTDSDPRGIEGYKTNKSMYLPTISVVSYLNDDYTGGELHFREFNLTVEPVAGSIVIFPSLPPYYHASLKLISGTKYIAPGFWNIKNPYTKNL